MYVALEAFKDSMEHLKKQKEKEDDKQIFCHMTIYNKISINN